MAKMKDAQIENTSGGIERTLGNAQLADLIIQVISTNIKNGYELENLIAQECGKRVIEDMETFEKKLNKLKDGTYVCCKNTANRKAYFAKKTEPDFMIFTVENGEVECKIVELKDGYNFDTKKSKSEILTLRKAAKYLRKKLNINVTYALCSFNQENKNLIINGLKKYFTQKNILTGIEFCGLLGIGYDKIQNIRKEDADENRKYFFDKMLEIDEFKEYCKTNLS